MKSALSVLFLTNVPSPYRVDFFESLGQLCNLTVVYESKEAHHRKKEWMKNGNINYKSNYLVGNILRGVFFPKNLKELLFQVDYDIYVVNGYNTVADMLAIYYLKRKRKKFLISCDGALLKEESFFKYKFKKALINSAKGLLSTGDVTTKYLQHYGAQENNIFVYPFSSIHKNEIKDNPLNFQEKKQIRSELGFKEKYIILTVGRFIHVKGIDLLLKASSSFNNDYGFYIIGDEPRSEYLEYVKENDIKNVHFIPFKQKRELLQFYMAADLFVLPTRGDVWGLVVNEALSSGLPVITTDKCVAGLELIKSGFNGDIVPAEDSEAIVYSIKKYFDNQEMHTIMAENCITSIQRYTIENMAERHFQIFKEL